MDNPPKYNWEGKTILIAEDVSHNFKFLRFALEPTHVTIVWAKNGQEAIDICEKDNSVDLVLMDINMPVMNGYKAIKLIKALDRNIPIITQTAYAFEGEREKSFEAGSDDYILKPIQVAELLKKVSKYL